jgi:hypothetical protein
VTGGASEFFTLAKDFERSSIKLAAALYDVYAEQGVQFAHDWAANARETSGTHGKYYPDSIDSETHARLGIEVEVGPNSAKKQGKMGRGFEFGSVNQPPHLDGARALPAAEQRLERAADLAIAYVVP